MSKDKRKRRTEALYATTKGVVGELVVTIDQRTGEISFGNAMTNSYSEVSYERKKGPKVISRVPQSHTGMTFRQQDALKKNFEFRCAVDTNTRIIQDKKVCVTGIVISRPQNIVAPDGTKTYWEVDVPFCVETTGLKPPPENFGWITAWEWLYTKGLIKPTTKVGMIVDSDLGNLHSYNERIKPVFADIMLPPNVALIYASSDVGKENVVNRMLAIVDSVSSQCLDAIEKGKAPFNNRTGDSEFFDAMRIINPHKVLLPPLHLS